MAIDMVSGEDSFRFEFETCLREKLRMNSRLSATLFGGWRRWALYGLQSVLAITCMWGAYALVYGVLNVFPSLRGTGIPGLTAVVGLLPGLFIYIRFWKFLAARIFGAFARVPIERGPEHVCVEINEAGLSWRTDGTHSSIQWHAIQAVVAVPEALLIVCGLSAFYIPNHALDDPGLRQKLIEFAKQRLAPEALARSRF